MAEKRIDFEALGRKYAELGYDLSPEEIERFAARVEIAEAGIDVVRSIDVSAHESATGLSLRRYGLESGNE